MSDASREVLTMAKPLPKTLTFTCPECHLPLQVPYTASEGHVVGREVQYDIHVDSSTVYAHINGHQLAGHQAEPPAPRNPYRSPTG
jgi:hypothetical protein